MTENHIHITLTNEEALVLLDFLTRFDKTEHDGVFEDQAEQKMLWIIEGQLEKQLVETFSPYYLEIIKTARNNVRDKE